jgi:hypothetical protein
VRLVTICKTGIGKETGIFLGCKIHFDVYIFRWEKAGFRFPRIIGVSLARHSFWPIKVSERKKIERAKKRDTDGKPNKKRKPTQKTDVSLANSDKGLGFRVQSRGPDLGVLVPGSRVQRFSSAFDIRYIQSDSSVGHKSIRPSAFEI